METLKRIFAIDSPEQFVKDYWRKSPYYNSNNDDFDDLLCFTDVSEFFKQELLSYPFLRVIANGEEVPIENYILDNDSTFKIISKDQLFKLFEEGSSIVIQAAQYQFANLHRLAEDMSSELGIEINANIYITPSNSQGFHPHFDTHEVIVLQIAGKKIWKLYDAPLPDPLKGWQVTKDQRNAYINGTPSHQICLQKGDALYIPRGVVHDAYCTDELSIHITFGLSQILHIDMLRQLVSMAERDSFFRKPFNDLMSDGNTSVQETIMMKIQKLLTELINKHAHKKSQKKNKIDGQELFEMFYLIDSIENPEEFSLLEIKLLSITHNISSTPAEIYWFNSLARKSFQHDLSQTTEGLPQIKQVLKSLVRRQSISVNYTLEDEVY